MSEWILLGNRPSAPEGTCFTIDYWYWPVYENLLRRTGVFTDDDFFAILNSNFFEATSAETTILCSELKKLDTPDFKILVKRDELGALWDIAELLTMNQRGLQKFIAFLEACNGFKSDLQLRGK